MQDADEAPLAAAEPRSTLPTWVRMQARNEANKWDALDEIRLTNDSRWLRSYGWLMMLFTWTFGLAFIAAFFIWGWHYCASPQYRWLQSAELDKIQSVLFSGGMGAIISGIIRAQISKAKAS